ncbi:MAG: hypothetical protein ACPL5F_05005 [Moorellaceae bacterium]
MLLRFEDTRLERLAAISVAQFRWWDASLKEVLRERGLIEDVYQALYFSAFLAWTDGLDPDSPENVKEVRRRAYRAIYRCLVDYGFRRPKGAKGFIWTDIPYAALSEPRIGYVEEGK